MHYLRRPSNGQRGQGGKSYRTDRVTSGQGASYFTVRYEVLGSFYRAPDTGELAPYGYHVGGFRGAAGGGIGWAISRSP